MFLVIRDESTVISAYMAAKLLSMCQVFQRIVHFQLVKNVLEGDGRAWSLVLPFFDDVEVLDKLLVPVVVRLSIECSRCCSANGKSRHGACYAGEWTYERCGGVKPPAKKQIKRANWSSKLLVGIQQK
eukprot:11300692-Ditylum_brightwellii.AAC.1